MKTPSETGDPYSIYKCRKTNNNLTKGDDRLSVTKEEYSYLVKKLSPDSRLIRDCAGAFCVGGFICSLGQVFTNTFLMLGLDTEVSRCMTSVSLIFLASLFTALGLYDKLAKFAGAGTLVPITGFSNAVTAPAIEFRSEGFIPGTTAKMFLIAGPVIVSGTVASVLYGVWIMLSALFI